MGGGSTSHGAVLSDKAAAVTSFDLHSWQGLTEVLKMGKESLRDPHAYSEFRNLVLQYAQQGGDAELRKQIDAIIATFKAAGAEEKPQNSVPVQAPRETSPKTVVGVTGRRLPPQFKVPQAEMKPSAASAPVQAPPQHELPIERVEETPQPVQPAETPQPESAPQTTPPQPAAAAVKEDAAAAGTVFKTLDEHKARIAEIKRIVNAEVGNPATLIDTHNELGKAYMKSLLAALKATGGGGEGVDQAMAALETTFTALIKDQKHENTKSAEQPEFPAAPDTKPAEPTDSSNDDDDGGTPMPVWDARADAIQENDEKILSVMRDMQKSKASNDSFTSFFIKSDKEKVPEAAKSAKGADAQPAARKSVDFIPPNRNAVREIGKRPLEDVKSESGIDVGEVAIKQTELSSPEITEALHQLLNEWGIFRGKGFFGMGPSGPEHPLYRTLAPLTMGEVIAGRWEGSDRKLTKVIKQYVDAWRHEQGIAYVITETFEHYLRRVVQRILKRQHPE